jgi:hypothetical protein
MIVGMSSRRIPDLEGEFWADVKGYEGVYQVSNLGRVKSLSRVVERSGEKGSLSTKERLMSQNPVCHGYSGVVLSKVGQKPKKYISHRLIAAAFWGESDLPINHINGIRHDNRLENLEYVTSAENTAHRFNTPEKPMGVTKSKNGKRWVANTYIIKDGKQKNKRIGTYDTQREAIDAFKKAYAELRGTDNKYIDFTKS